MKLLLIPLLLTVIYSKWVRALIFVFISDQTIDYKHLSEASQRMPLKILVLLYNGGVQGS